MLETEPQIIERYIRTGKAKIVYRHLLQLGDRSERAAEANECAGDQGKFWQMRHLLYERQSDLYDAQDLDGLLTNLAQGLGMDGGTLGTCLSKHTHQAAVAADSAASTAAGITGRPVFIIGTTRIIGAQPITAFEQALGT